MPRASLHCPTCGAPTSPDARRCHYCDTSLTAIQCSNCYGALFAGSRFCPHCGRHATPRRDVDIPAIVCPRCGPGADHHARMKPVALRSVQFDECPDCGGVWLDRATFDLLATSAEAQSETLDFLGPDPRGIPERRVQYIRCPLCADMMHRHNYARRSGVVLDRCINHGLWFDHDELRQTLEFIRSGGLDRARQADAQRQKLDAQRRADEADWLNRHDRAHGTLFHSPTPDDDPDPSAWLRRLLSEILRP